MCMEEIEEKKNQLRADRAELFSNRDCFVLSGDTVSYVSVNEKKLLLFGGDNTFEERQNVRQYSRSERNSAILFENGEIEVRGDNSYGQCDIQVTGPAP